MKFCAFGNLQQPKVTVENRIRKTNSRYWNHVKAKVNI